MAQPLVKVPGYSLDLTDGRSVWVAKRGDAWHVELKSRETSLQFSMSKETADALVRLLTRYPERVARVSRNNEAG